MLINCCNSLNGPNINMLVMYITRVSIDKSIERYNKYVHVLPQLHFE